MDYVSEFDYLICNPSDEHEREFIDGCANSGNMKLALVGTSGPYELYQIKKIQKELTILSEIFTEAIPITLDTVRWIPFPTAEGEVFQISQEMKNTGTEPAYVRFQINWKDANDELVDVSLEEYTLQPGERASKTSSLFTAPGGAVKGVLYLTPNGDTSPLAAYGYELHQIYNQEAFSRINSLIKERVYLR